MRVWKIGLCFMLSTLCCVNAISWGQEGPGGPGGPGGGGGTGGGGSGGSGPGGGEELILHYCYVEEKYDCSEVAAHLTAFELQPLRVFCGQCYELEENVWECPSSPGTAIYPTPSNPDPTSEKPIPYAKKWPEFAGGNVSGKKQITQLQEVNCGEIKSCTGCPEVWLPNTRPFCKTDSTNSPWMITPLELSGEECQTSIQQ